MPRWASSTFLSKLSLSTGLLLLFATVLVGFTASHIAREHLTQELKGQMQKQGQLLLLHVPKKGLVAADTAELGAWVRRYGSISGARVTITELMGRVVADSEVPHEKLSEVENHANRPEIIEALADGMGTALRHSKTVGADFLYMAFPIHLGDRRWGTLRLALPMKSVKERVRSLQQGILVASLFCMFGVLILSLYVNRSIHQPVVSLFEVAERLAQGDFSARAEPQSKDELGRLGEILNTLSARVTGMIAELSTEKVQLKATLDNMIEAVALIDPAGKVQEFNPVMEKLFGTRSVKARDKLVSEVLSNTPLESLVEKALKERTSEQGEYSLFTPEERVFEAYVNPIFAGDELQGAVLVMHDITRLRRLEKMRKEFVANVSHELRTPLASIKGFAETLLRGGINDSENRVGFVETIERHANNLTRLVDDLLELASIESGKRGLRKEIVPLGEFVEKAIENLHPLAERHKVTMSSSVAGDVKVFADKAALYQIMENLIANAIKYNREPGTVDISAVAEERHMRVTVSDTGIGIPEKDIPRLFERFYRVDKARSRKMGGTGLGLSIVKHLVESHGGTIHAESQEDRGSSFHFTLPTPSA